MKASPEAFCRINLDVLFKGIIPPTIKEIKLSGVRALASIIYNPHQHRVVRAVCFPKGKYPDAWQDSIYVDRTKINRLGHFAGSQTFAINNHPRCPIYTLDSTPKTEQQTSNLFRGLADVIRPELMQDHPSWDLFSKRFRPHAHPALTHFSRHDDLDGLPFMQDLLRQTVDDLHHRHPAR